MHKSAGTPPPDPARQPTRMEWWYLTCLRTWCKRKKHAPAVHELAGWLGKSSTAVYSALVALEHKGYVGRAGKTNARYDRRFVPVGDV
jgi:hypothetical protein